MMAESVNREIVRQIGMAQKAGENLDVILLIARGKLPLYGKERKEEMSEKENIRTDRRPEREDGVSDGAEIRALLDEIRAEYQKEKEKAMADKFDENEGCDNGRKGAEA